MIRNCLPRSIARSLAGLAAGLAVGAAAHAIEPGAAAPELNLPGANGTVKLADYRGKLVYVDFWASWCKPCVQSFPWMNEMQQRYGAQGFQVIGVNVDTRTDDARKFLAETPAKFVVAFDTRGEAPKSYAIKGMPTSFLVGPDGKVLLQHAGFRDADRAELEAKIRQSLGAR
ncbi:MAG TPA: TlpA disulfide reductase family protein [Burkholderiaceae bacterium]|jgi:thiol-disulfide isomerase/thioredoxin|nr:TlpA disulfide reductase family protein [Burkholderiaceae bacterium]HRA78278.1 TlpA disulfide reductase family protein [Burkholderiaceae bacterium]